MTVTELIPAVQRLSNTDKLLLLQVLVQELLKSEGIAEVIESTINPEGDASPSSLTLTQRQAVLNHPLAERRRLLAEQAAALQTHYDQISDWRDIMAGDIVNY
jgi:hypothetical protein